MSLSENRLACPLFTPPLALIDSNTPPTRNNFQGEYSIGLSGLRGLAREESWIGDEVTRKIKEEQGSL